MGIQEGGSTLMVTEVDGGIVATGTLEVKGACEASYDITLRQR